MRETLNGRIESAIVPLLLGCAEHICLIDPPVQPNVGDSVILLGELDFLARNFPRSRRSFYDVRSYSPGADRFINEASVLLLHGGGNFGDLWPHHHELRLRMLRQFRHKKIIQFPQSIHFESNEMLMATADAIRAHKDFTLLVRDKISFDFAARHFDCRILLVPDMAFAMRPITRKPPTLDYFCLFRTDKEAVMDRDAVLAALRGCGGSIEVADWLDEPETFTMRLDRSLGWRTQARPARMAPFRSAMVPLRRHYAQSRLNYGIDRLSRGATVVTDRLHAHILCCLLDIPHFVFNSWDGKIAAFHDTWTRDYPTARLISSAADLSA